MELVSKVQINSQRVALLPGSFHPVTRAHMALAEAALEHADTVLLVMPRAFPHKSYEGVSLAERLELLQLAVTQESRLGVAISEGGLSIEMAREAREVFGAVRISVVCGRDAAERILQWHYPPALSMATQLREYELLVAARQGDFQPLPVYGDRIRILSMPQDHADVSSTELRRRIKEKEPWEHLAPVAVRDRIEQLYAVR